MQNTELAFLPQVITCAGGSQISAMHKDKIRQVTRLSAQKLSTLRPQLDDANVRSVAVQVRPKWAQGDWFIYRSF